MSEYIDKKALLDEICRDNCERSYDGTCHNCRMTETIADFPAADVQPVVRCKDCKHMEFQGECEGRYCKVWGFFNSAGDDGFCNYGERKEPDHEV